jgi:hypothetical protein
MKQHETHIGASGSIVVKALQALEAYRVVRC